MRQCVNCIGKCPLRWRHNGRGGVSNYQPHECLRNCLFRHRSKKTSKLRVNGLCEGNSPWPVNSPHKFVVTRKMFPFDDVIMHWDTGSRGKNIIYRAYKEIVLKYRLANYQVRKAICTMHNEKINIRKDKFVILLISNLYQVLYYKNAIQARIYISRPEFERTMGTHASRYHGIL